MRVRINNRDTFIYTRTSVIEPLKFKGDVVVSIDPSKTNMAVIVGNPIGEIYSILEFSGNDMSILNKVQDTTDYCLEVKDFLTKYFTEVDIYDVAIEQAVTYHNEKANHAVNMVLTEIRGTVLAFFKDVYNLKVHEINNWAWKKAVLPEGYRGMSEKGSLRYLKKFGYDGYTDDVTDAVCIYMYVCRKYLQSWKIVCMNSEKSVRPYTYRVLPESLELDGLREFSYNKNYSLSENLTYYANRTGETGFCYVKTDYLCLEDIYGHSQLFFELSNVTDKVKVVVTCC